MTSNIGVRTLKDFGQGVGFNTSARKENSEDHSKGVIQNALKRTFSPEFLNRIDDVVIFNSLGKDEIFKIIDITLKDLFKRIENLGYKFKLSKKVKDFVAEKGYDPQFGARPLNRAVQKYIEDPLADYILNHNPASSSTLTATIDKENNIIIKEDKVSETTSDK